MTAAVPDPQPRPASHGAGDRLGPKTLTCAEGLVVPQSLTTYTGSRRVSQMVDDVQRLSS
jgi:hypothetical protein